MKAVNDGAPKTGQHLAEPPKKKPRKRSAATKPQVEPKGAEIDLTGGATDDLPTDGPPFEPDNNPDTTPADIEAEDADAEAGRVADGETQTETPTG